MTDLVAMGGFALTIGATLVAVTASHVRLQMGQKEIARRLDVINGSQDRQDTTLGLHGERLSHIEGREEGPRGARGHPGEQGR